MNSNTNENIVITDEMEQTFEIVDLFYDTLDTINFLDDNGIELTKEQFDVLVDRYHRTKNSDWQEHLMALINSEPRVIPKEKVTPKEDR